MLTCSRCKVEFAPHSRRSRLDGHEIVWRYWTADGPGPHPWRLLHIAA